MESGTLDPENGPDKPVSAGQLGPGLLISSSHRLSWLRDGPAAGPVAGPAAGRAVRGSNADSPGENGSRARTEAHAAGRRGDCRPAWRKAAARPAAQARESAQTRSGSGPAVAETAGLRGVSPETGGPDPVASRPSTRELQVDAGPAPDSRLRPSAVVG